MKLNAFLPAVITLGLLGSQAGHSQNLGAALPLLANLSTNTSAFGDIGASGILPRGIGTLLVLPAAGELVFSNNNGPTGALLGLGGPLKGQLVPAFDVLVNTPAELPDYFLNGGTLISPELVIVPPVPLLSAPLLAIPAFPALPALD
ncbi:hypothetical protein NCG89_13245 [Spongiibacter taiwanensis]|uniref:hypothetical protein n=1 Tax=Spongiibacter taiwanensis TaxID=1748242 RepID=UPI0020356450|nr:hypothetical protein [Spongiibacter taiwanensis]USA42492.1 hypothetical protein NCG89_13245 [Spongiibacter taiwanensis]